MFLDSSSGPSVKTKKRGPHHFTIFFEIHFKFNLTFRPLSPKYAPTHTIHFLQYVPHNSPISVLLPIQSIFFSMCHTIRPSHCSFPHNPFSSVCATQFAHLIILDLISIMLHMVQYFGPLVFYFNITFPTTHDYFHLFSI
jgi:hypothetical protein